MFEDAPDLLGLVSYQCLHPMGHSKTLEQFVTSFLYGLGNKYCFFDALCFFVTDTKTKYTMFFCIKAFCCSPFGMCWLYPFLSKDVIKFCFLRTIFCLPGAECIGLWMNDSIPGIYGRVYRTSPS